jgi:hypothetical protein
LALKNIHAKHAKINVVKFEESYQVLEIYQDGLDEKDAFSILP